MILDVTRQEGALDKSLMRNARVLGIGTGGASGLYEDLARSGLGSLTVMDFDTVDATNLTTQGYDEAQVGMLKVDALGVRLKAICPEIYYRPVNRDFLEISEEEMTELVADQDLILMMTDNFYAQARGNLVALKHSKSAIFAITYALARCSEITFIIPGITPACHRCAVSSRYASYEKGFVNDTKQQASTVFQTHYLNCCIGLISLAVLHNATNGLEFSHWFKQPWRQNLLQIRMHPSYGSQEGSLFQRILGKTGRNFTFDSVWQMIEEEAPPKYEACPDCGGIGDLSKVVGIVSTSPRINHK